MDPVIVALLLTFTFASLMKAAERAMSKSKTKGEIDTPSPVLGKVIASTGLSKKKTEFDCAVWDQRHFEKKLVEAGIMANVEAMCEDKECPECYPNRPGNGKALPTGPAPGARVEYRVSCVSCNRPVVVKSRNTKFAHCRECSRDSARIYLDRQKTMAAEKKRAREAYEKSRSGKQRVAEVSGRVVPIPHNVPKFATGALYYDSGRLDPFIGWKWHDMDDINQPVRSYRQNISKEMFDSFPIAGGVRADTINHTPVTAERIYPPRPPKGPGGGSPAIREILNKEREKYAKELKAQQYALNEYKREIEYFNNALKNLNQYNKGTRSTGPQ